MAKFIGSIQITLKDGVDLNRQAQGLHPEVSLPMES